MSKAQVEYDYQKLLWERSDKILKDRKKTLFGRIIDRSVAKHYPMPLMPLDEDYKPAPKRLRKKIK